MKSIVAVILAAVLIMTGISIGEEITWICPVCGKENTKNFCGNDGTSRTGWVCEACGTFNSGDGMNFCSFCGASRESDVIDDKWTCLFCGQVNAADTIYCGYCAAEKGTAPKYEVGDIITFGNYEQDGDETNGLEPIEWRVLEDKGDGTYLLISEYGLEAKAYNDVEEAVTWETCTLRSWLNGEFLNTAFTKTERDHLVTVTNENPDNASSGTSGGNTTLDTVWLLSLDEGGKYFDVDANNYGESENLICMSTKHARDNGCYYALQEGTYNSWAIPIGACWWWLRSPGSLSIYAANMDSNGSVYAHGSGVAASNGCVRPVVVVRFS